MIKAEWGMDYDWRNDKCFDRPMHNRECDAPILFIDGAYRCIGCGEEMDLEIVILDIERIAKKLKEQKND